MQQLNLFDIEEKQNREDEIFQKKTKLYKKWLTLPNEIHVLEGSEERNDLHNILYEGFCELYADAYHVCETMPDGRYIWLNHCNKDYWILNKIDKIGGKHVETCPFCSAKLGEGKGNAILYKAEAKHWLFYLYHDIPMREQGFQTKEERLKIKEFWG